MQQKSQVMQIFADISEESIKDMITSIGQISMQEISYDSKLELKRRLKTSKETSQQEMVSLKTGVLAKQTDDLIALYTNTQTPGSLPGHMINETSAQKLAKKRECLNKSG